jgi:hypothetical protein
VAKKKKGFPKPTIYSVVNKEKYIGDVNNVIARSKLERRFMRIFDTRPDILQWSSEELAIPYIHPIDNKFHRYFPDFWLKLKNKNGVITECLVEIKPYSQTKKPKSQKIITESYKNTCLTWLVNQAKWKAAKEFAKKQGIDFILMTEKDL